MALVTSWPSVRQALLRQLRANLVLEDQLKGDWSEGFAPSGTAFPRGVISLHYAPAQYDWSGVVNILGVDVLIFSKDAGDAASIFQLAYTTLQDQRLTVTGQTSLSCRFSSSLSLQDEDAQGKPIYESGGVLEVMVAQSNPALRSLVFTADSTLS
jgi:hypothetical protein